MDILEAMQLRHSVRAYTGKPIEGEVLAALQAAIAKCHFELAAGKENFDRAGYSRPAEAR